MDSVGRRFGGIVLIILLTVAGLCAVFHFPGASGDGTGDHPPPPQGDWIVGNTTFVSNETIFLNGLLNVTNNATLTLDNVTLIYNSSSSFTQRIYVDWGAELFILNSNITSTQTWYAFEANGDLTIENSLLSRINGGIRLNPGNHTVTNSTFFNNPQYAIICFGDIALYNNSDLSNIVLINNTFHSNYCGLLVSFFEEPWLYNNTFTDNEWGIISHVFGSPYLYGNTISHNLYGGIVGELGYIALYNNRISSNGGYGVKGDHTTIYAYNNSIYDNGLWGIYGFNAPILHDDNIYSKDAISGSQGGLLQEWEVLLNTKDAENNTLGNVNITVHDHLGNLVWTGTTIGSVRTLVLREYEILNNGTQIVHEPFTINAKKGEYFGQQTYEIEPYEEITIILEPRPEEPPEEQRIPSWFIALVAVIWLLVFVFVILGILVQYFEKRKQ